jgi:hypothetical protein
MDATERVGTRVDGSRRARSRDAIEAVSDAFSAQPLPVLELYLRVARELIGTRFGDASSQSQELNRCCVLGLES